MNIQYRTFTESVKNSIDSKLKEHHVDFLTITGSIIEDMKSYESEIESAILERVNEIGRNNSECIEQARFTLRNASIASGEKINGGVRHWYGETHDTYEFYVGEFIDLIQERTQIMPLITLLELTNRNSVTEIQLIIRSLQEVVKDQIENEFDIFVDYFISSFLHFNTLTTIINFNFQNYFNLAYSELQRVGNSIVESLSECDWLITSYNNLMKMKINNKILNIFFYHD